MPTLTREQRWKKMSQQQWEKILLPNPNEDYLWELFHENSKSTIYQESPSDEEVFAKVRDSQESLPYKGYPCIELPDKLPSSDISLHEVIGKRVSPNFMSPCSISIEHLTLLLRSGYGITHQKANPLIPHSCRSVPSGGALFPLEIFFFSQCIQGLKNGLYHYNPPGNALRLLNEEDLRPKLADSLIQPYLGWDAAILVMITAVFERSTFKYGDRGYRFILLEAGHLAQNINLVATGLGLSCLNIGGYFDRKVDRILGIDGITHSTIYMAAIGKTGEPNDM